MRCQLAAWHLPLVLLLSLLDGGLEHAPQPRRPWRLPQTAAKPAARGRQDLSRTVQFSSVVRKLPESRAGHRPGRNLCPLADAAADVRGPMHRASSALCGQRTHREVWEAITTRTSAATASTPTVRVLRAGAQPPLQSTGRACWRARRLDQRLVWLWQAIKGALQHNSNNNHAPRCCIRRCWQQAWPSRVHGTPGHAVPEVAASAAAGYHALVDACHAVLTQHPKQPSAGS